MERHPGNRGNVESIKLQIEDGVTGYMVNTVENVQKRFDAAQKSGFS